MTVWVSGRGVGPQEISRRVEIRVSPFPLALVFTHRLALDYHILDNHTLGLIEAQRGLGWRPASWSPARSDHLITHRSGQAAEGTQGASPQSQILHASRGSILFVRNLDLRRPAGHQLHR